MPGKKSAEPQKPQPAATAKQSKAANSYAMDRWLQTKPREEPWHCYGKSEQHTSTKTKL
jgi:hypothetical protein